MANLLPREVDFAETAPVRIEGSATLAATPAEVWAVLLDYDAWPRWFRGVHSCHATSDPPTGVGSTRRVGLAKGRSTVDERFVAWEDERLWAFTATAMSPALFRSLVERATIEPGADGRTTVTYRMAFDPKPALRPALPLLRSGVRRNLEAAMVELGREVQRRRPLA
ncbi:MAG: SRPBCC family protein [Acidimicrobiales bacterium]